MADFIFWGSQITADGDCNKGQGYVFSSGHVWMWELDYKESWEPKNWCFWTVVLKTLESPLERKEIQPVHPKGDQSWVFIGRTDVEAETPILWTPDAKSWLFWKDLDAGKDRGQEEKGMTLVMDRKTSCAVVRGVAKSRTQLSNWTDLNWIFLKLTGFFLTQYALLHSTSFISINMFNNYNIFQQADTSYFI